MKKFILTMCLIAVTTGIANAGPIKHNHPAPNNHLPKAQKVVHKAPPAVPVVYQVPVQVPVYSSGYPSVTLSNRYFDLTVGL